MVLVAIAATYLFLNRTYMGTAIRAISQDRAIMPLMGVNRARVYLLTSAIGGALAGLAACLLVLQYDVHPAIGLTFGPLTFLICVLGGLGNLIGGFVAAFVFAQFISVGGFFFQLEWGYVIAFAFFIATMFWRPEGLLARREEGMPTAPSKAVAAGPRQAARGRPPVAGGARGHAAAARPGQLHLHLMVMALLWSSIYTSWSIMGRLGHGQLRPRCLPRHRRVHGGAAVESPGISPWLGAVVAVMLTLGRRARSSGCRAFASRSSATTSRSSRWRCRR